MSRNPNAFTGLYTEYRELSLPDPKLYGIASDTDPSGYSINAGTHTCTHTSPFFPFGEFTVDCPNEGELEIVTTFDLMDAQVSVTGGPSPYTETVAERAALLPEPAYVQVRFSDTEFRTHGGNNGCPAPSAPESCLPGEDGSVHFAVGSTIGYYPWGEPEANGLEDNLRAGGEGVDFGVGGALRRIGGPVYAGAPANDAVDELIPWAEFAADPTGTLTTTAEHVHELRRLFGGMNVTLWYVNVVPLGRVSYVGAA